MMPALYPDLERQFERAATRAATSRRRFLRPLALGVAIATTSAGAAYAAYEVWQPQLGRPGDERVAVTGRPIPAFFDHVRVLRRPQTDEDRSSAAQFALKFPAAQAGVRTNFVRSLGTIGGAAVVLIPTSAEVSGAPDGTDELCLWVADGASNNTGSRQCVNATDFADGKLFVAIGAAEESDSQRAEARRAFREKFLREHPEGGSLVLPPELREDTESFTVVGVAPDSVSTADIGAAEPAATRDNWFSGIASTVPAKIGFDNAAAARSAR